MYNSNEFVNNDKDECKKVTHRYLGKGPDYLVVHLQHLMITDPTDQSGIRPDSRVLMHDTYTDYPRLNRRVSLIPLTDRAQNAHSLTVQRGQNAHYVPSLYRV